MENNNRQMKSEQPSGNEKKETAVDRRDAARRTARSGPGIWKILARVGISILLTVVLLLFLVWTLIFTVAHGPSKAMRDLLVGAAMQASATKWVPYLVLSSDEVSSIMEEAAREEVEVFSPDELANRFVTKIVTDENGKKYEITVLEGDNGSAVITDPDGSAQVVEDYDEWKYAIDGIQFNILNRSGFKAYMLIIRDPSRVYVGTSSNYKQNLPGMRFYEMAEKEQCAALMNGGEFFDPGGQGDGGAPQGMTYSKGECVWSDGYYWKTFIGFNKDNKLIVTENLTPAKADALGVRDGVCFRPAQTSSSSRLIYQDDSGSVHVSSYGSSSPAQRSAIGQRADGAVIFLVTDGRSAASLGASYNDVTQLMYEYGAVTAGMLDGGSSAMLYLRDYFTTYKDQYDFDNSRLDEYQRMGLVNKYVAATSPRHIPTYFCVAKGGE